MKYEYRVVWYRDNGQRTRRFGTEAAAQKRCDWLNSKKSLHEYCLRNDDYGEYGSSHVYCLSPLIKPAIVQRREVGSWE